MLNMLRSMSPREQSGIVDLAVGYVAPLMTDSLRRSLPSDLPGLAATALDPEFNAAAAIFAKALVTSILGNIGHTQVPLFPLDPWSHP